MNGKDQIYSLYRGQRISRLTIVGSFFRVRDLGRVSSRRSRHHWYCVVQCDCGQFKIENISSLPHVAKWGLNRSCGCVKRERMKRLKARLHPPVEFLCWGESKTLRAWARDPRCQVSESGLRYRVLRKRLALEDALTSRCYRVDRENRAG